MLKNHLFNKKENDRKQGECVICNNFVNIRDNLGRCIDCHNSWYKNHHSLQSVRISGNKNLIDFHHNGEVSFKINNECKIHKNEKMLVLL